MTTGADSVTPLDLHGLLVGLSISADDETARLGFDASQVDGVVREVSEQLLARGAAVLFGHDWRSPGAMDGVLAAAKRQLAADANLRPRLRSLAPWPDQPSLDEAARRALDKVLTVEMAGLPAALLPVAESAEQGTALHRYLRARGLSFLRRRMVSMQSARLCIGGRVAHSQGRYPGVVEEILLSLEAGHPVYLNAMFGGAAARVIAAIEAGGGVDSALAPTDPMVLAAFTEFGATLEPGEADARIDASEFLAPLRRTDIEQLARGNGLTEQENRKLFHTTDLAEVLETVVRGLSRLRERGSFDAEGRCRVLTWGQWFGRFGLSQYLPTGMAPLPWRPTAGDREAAWLLYVELSTRIATQDLHYRSGDVAAALESVYQLFPKTREILARFCAESAHFEGLASAILNGRIRSFTAKWDGRRVDGRLRLVDQGNEFRADLQLLRPTLRRFRAALRELSGASPRLSSRSSDDADDADATGSVRRERVIALPPIEASFGWIRSQRSNVRVLPGALSDEAVQELERDAILARRARAGCDPLGTVGLALSGGGIRSATFCLGVLQVLAKNRVLDQVDFLSTVSGGGYVGSFLSQALSAEGAPQTRELLDNNGAPMRELRKRADNHLLWSSYGRGAFELVLALARGWVIHAIALFALLAVALWFDPLLERLSGWLLWGWGPGLGLLVFTGISAFAVQRTDREGERRSYRAAQGLVLLFVAAGTYRAGAWLYEVVFHGSASFGTSLSALAATPLVGRLIPWVKQRPAVSHLLLQIAIWVIVPLVVVLAYFGLREWVPTLGDTGCLLLVVGWAASVLVIFVVPINRLAPHAIYRRRLVDAFLGVGPTVPLSGLGGGSGSSSPYHLVNATVNLPGSRSLAVRGRLSDLFVFSRAVCGSSVTGWFPTKTLESVDPHLDLGTAMAISGAAVSSHMGTIPSQGRGSLLALANLRLGYWLPNLAAEQPGQFAGLHLLWNEIAGRMDETDPFLNISDGGHIENLGIYELLRRRCRFIIAVDAEADDGVHCSGLIKALREARVDFDVQVDLVLDDLTRGPDGNTKAHFALGVILYPGDERGYLLYVKASMTGDEERDLREYRAAHPTFPHESTADQFFDEEQFEAYRTLGEHIGSRLFWTPFVKADAPPPEDAPVDVDLWLDGLREHLLPQDHADQGIGWTSLRTQTRAFGASAVRPAGVPRPDPRRLHL